jgi:hypothetical protein
MEFIQLCQQLKSLAGQMIMMPLGDQLSQLSKALNLNDIQVSAIYADSMIVLAYLILLISKTNAARVKILSAFLFTLVIAYTPIYGALSQVGYYCALAMIYITTARYVTNKQIKYTVVIMAVFQLFMATDSYANPKTETWLFLNFEEVTLLIHALIVSSCYRIKPIDLGAILGRLINSLRGLAHSNCLAPRL